MSERLYQDYFGLSAAPFAITPDPAFVYLSRRHQDALAHLLYGVGQGGGGGFVQLTGEVGTGKTTLCRCLLEQTPPGTRVALILNPVVTPAELLAAICDELEIDHSDLGQSPKRMVDRLNHYLLAAHAQGDQVVVVIDEAQNLSRDALEQVRLLTNLETATDKLLQIILLGQPELRELLAQENLRQLSQRITARYHLDPLGEQETEAYVRHRMRVAGSRHTVFTSAACKALYRHSGGVPRLINIFADRALVGAYARDLEQVDAKLVEQAVADVRGQREQQAPGRWRPLALVSILALLALLGWYLWPDLRSLPDARETEAAVAQATDDNSDAAEQIPQQAEPTLPADNASSAEPPEPLSEADESTEPAMVTPPDAELLARLDQAAWPGLAAAWQQPQAAGELAASCSGGPQAGFACLNTSGTWQRIRMLGLPVVLQLADASASRLTLLGLSADQAWLAAPDEGIEALSLAALEPLWLGQYSVAWPQSRDWPRQLMVGTSDPAVAIVQELATAMDPPWTGSVGEQFGQDFGDWVQGFQVRSGLQADGIVGPATLLYLLAPGVQTPRLQQDWPQAQSADSADQAATPEGEAG